MISQTLMTFSFQAKQIIFVTEFVSLNYINCKCMILISSWGICAEVHFVHPAKLKIFMPCELKTFDFHKYANIFLYKSECKLLKWDSWRLPNKKEIHP